MTCDHCELSLMCLSGNVDESVRLKLCLTCGRVWLPGMNVFRCAAPLQLSTALAHRLTQLFSPRGCDICGPHAQQRLRSGVPIIKTVYFDLDDHDLHSA